MYVQFSVILFLYCCAKATTEVNPIQCDCGRANEKASKIIGGAVVKPHKYPWMVTLYSGEERICGGALITRQYVLTAAHCVSGKQNINIGIAVHDQSKPGDIIPAADFKVHPDYEQGSPINDVALIKLQKGVAFSEKVRTLCLPHDLKYEEPDKHAIVAGWGYTQPENNKQSRFLKEVILKIIDASSEITARGTNKTGVCSGDSGSPLFTKYSDGRFHVIGVTSSGPKPCMGLSHYVRVSNFNKWIQNNIMDSVKC